MLIPLVPSQRIDWHGTVDLLFFLVPVFILAKRFLERFRKESD